MLITTLLIQELRILDVRGNDLKSVPESIGELKHLKFACFAENVIEKVNLAVFLDLPDLKDLCFFSNRLENRDEMEDYIHCFKAQGKLLRVGENRVDISQESK